MTTRFVFVIALSILTAHSAIGQGEVEPLEVKTLTIHYIVGPKERQLDLGIGQRLKLDLVNGDRVKGIIERIEEESIIISGHEVFYKDIAQIKNRGGSSNSSKVIGGVGVSGILVSGLVGAAGLALASTEPILVIVFGVTLGLLGAVGIIYSGVVMASAGIIALTSKVIDVKGHKAEFRVHGT